MGKKGELIGVESLVFLLLNALFFIILLFFIHSSQNNSFVYEQAYAKEIALMIDNAKPEMTIVLNLTDLKKQADIYKTPLDKAIKIDENENKVLVNLRGKGGYSYQFFSGYKTNLIFNDNWMTLKVKEK